MDISPDCRDLLKKCVTARGLSQEKIAYQIGVVPIRGDVIMGPPGIKFKPA